MNSNVREYILSGIKPFYKSLRTQKLNLLFQMLGAGEQGKPARCRRRAGLPGRVSAALSAVQ